MGRFEEDVIPAGEAAKGYIAGSFASDGVGFPVIQDIQKNPVRQRQGQSVGPGRHRHGQLQPWRDRRDHDGGSHPRGTRQKVRQKALNGDEVRWGLEHLDLSPARLKALGAANMIPGVKTSCANHEGSGYTRFMQWDGKAWKPASAGLPRTTACSTRW